MSHDGALAAKCTRQLLERIRQIREDEPIEVIVRIKDPHALERLESAKGQAIEAVVGAEQQHTDNLLKGVVEAIRRFEQQGLPVRLLDTSWLTHSVLASAPPKVVKILARRKDVDLIDLNTEFGSRLIAAPCR